MPQKTDNPSVQIVVRGLVKRYHYQPVLDQLSLTVEDGAFCVLVGANGSGKTTLLRILASLVKPNQGEIHIGQPVVMQSTELRQLIGYVGHQPMFYNDLTAVENLRHYARLYQCPQPETRIEAAIHTAGLTAHQHKPVRTFSRGMQQRLSIARALLHDPRILLFDEPYTGLDQEAAHHLDQLLQRLHHPGCLILLAAHRPGALINIASHIAWLQNGRISHHIPVERLPEMPELQAYLQEGA